jgi:hypothetical protein
MTTDDNPVDYRYVSLRLTSNIVQQHVAARSRWRLLLDLKGGPLNIGIRGIDPDYVNRFDLAQRATEAVRDNTGSLEVPGTYIRSTLYLQTCKVIVHHGLEAFNAEVVGFFGDEEVSDVGRVFVALFGSIENFTGRKRKPRFDTEQHPSDAAGLYEILNANREPGDPGIVPEELDDDKTLDTYDSFDSAHGIAYRHNEPLLPVQCFDFLAVVHHYEVGIELNHVLYDLAVLGGPVWIATPRPGPLRAGHV